LRDFGLKKLYYSISEVSKLTALEQYILRYWENEFEQLKPAKNRAGNRIYTNKDIQLILKIKKLLRDEKYTIEGAKKVLSGIKETKKVENPKGVKATVNEILVEDKEKNVRSLKEDLEEIRNFLVDLRSKL
jgi:DNA-binding transcriptional MerR regulator